MSDFLERQWAGGGKKARARAEAVRKPLREAVKAASEKGLAGIKFASSTAGRLARENQLYWGNFEGHTSSSPNGFTAADVRKILKG
jgi:hypothetical protein